MVPTSARLPPRAGRAVALLRAAAKWRDLAPRHRPAARSAVSGDASTASSTCLGAGTTVPAASPSPAPRGRRAGPHRARQGRRAVPIRPTSARPSISRSDGSWTPHRRRRRGLAVREYIESSPNPRLFQSRPRCGLRLAPTGRRLACTTAMATLGMTPAAVIGGGVTSFLPSPNTKPRQAAPRPVLDIPMRHCDVFVERCRWCRRQCPRS